MKKRELTICMLLLVGIALFPALWAIGIDWIQSDERVVGENHPYYEDVVNRPAKQIYALYTSEHNTDGTHKPLPYASSADLNSYMLKSTYDGDADSRADTAEVLTDGSNISSASAVRSHLDATTIHRSINDSSTATTDLWSASKISSALAAVGSLPIMSNVTEPDIDSNSAAFWVDTYSGQFWLILDNAGTQKKVELTTGL